MIQFSTFSSILWLLSLPLTIVLAFGLIVYNLQHFDNEKTELKKK